MHSSEGEKIIMTLNKDRYLPQLPKVNKFKKLITNIKGCGATCIGNY